MLSRKFVYRSTVTAYIDLRESPTSRDLHTMIRSTACSSYRRRASCRPHSGMSAPPQSFCTARAPSDMRSPASGLLPCSGGRSLGPVDTGCGTSHVRPRPPRAWPACRVLPSCEACQMRPAPRDEKDARPGDGAEASRTPCLDRISSFGSTYERDLQARARRTKPPCKLNPVLALLEADATYRPFR